ncbi:MAG: sigma-54 dependent transcriptional regulator [Candidatus Cloacimonadales bacterium]
MNTILVVEDNKDMQFILKNVLEAENYKFVSAGNGKRAINEAKKKKPDLVLLDMRLPGMNGFDILQEVQTLYPGILVIMMTAFADVKDAVIAMKMGAYDYITKPFDNDELLLIIQKALRTESLTREVSCLRRKLREKENQPEFMGESKTIKDVLRKVELIAPTKMSVILQGKSGTGKEVIARLIHQKSERSEKPFVAVDCGAIPPTLVESELFGYEAGAFTGAEKSKQGKFLEADGGTMLLDEITNLSIEGQAKLLRALEERKILPLGGKELIDVDVRIIVTSNLSFSETIKQGEFRDDLFHRLNEFQIILPELKSRQEDILPLAEHFLFEANTELGKSIEGFEPEVAEHFTNYHWPGNVREMKHMIKRAALMTSGELIEIDCISFEEVGEKCQPDLQLALDQGRSFNSIIMETEKELIRQALRLVNGNKSRAAEMLSLNRKTLYRKLEIYGLN